MQDAMYVTSPGKDWWPVCYNNHRKYLPTNHELRNLTPLSQRQTSMFQYYSNERVQSQL